jgi:hypothetical protein
VVGDGDGGHDGFAGDVLGLGETEICHQLRLGRDRDCDGGTDVNPTDRFKRGKMR